MQQFKKILVFILGGLLILTSNSAALAAQVDEDLIMGVFPRRNAIDTMKLFTPLAKHLSVELGRNVRLETAKNFPVFWKKVQNGKYDIVHYNQYHYVKSNEKYGYQVFAKNEEFGGSTIAPAIVVRKDSGITSLQDLKGKKIVFGGGKKAMVAYVGSTVMLRNAGLNKGDYIEEFAKNPPNATFATFYKRADASGVGNVALSIPVVKKRIETDQLKYVEVGNNLPHIPWAYKESLSDELKAGISRVMLSLNGTPKGKGILKKARLTDISPAKDKEYDIIRNIIIEYEVYSK